MDVNQPTINLRDCETIKCENCEGIYFKEVIVLKKISRFQIPNAVADQEVPYSVYKCDSCGHVNKGSNPFEEDDKIIMND